MSSSSQVSRLNNPDLDWEGHYHANQPDDDELTSEQIEAMRKGAEVGDHES